MKVGIVGAGITGLALTHYLAREEIESVVFEASDEVGGAITSRHADGRVLEVGPQRIRKTPGVAELLTAAGVEDEVIEATAEDLYVYADGKLSRAPMSLEAFVETDLLSWTGKARLLAEVLTRDGMEQETVRDLFVRKFGTEAYEKFIGPLYGGIYGSDPAEMPAAFALERLMQGEKKAGSFLQAFRKRLGRSQAPPAVSLTEGIQQLPDSLAERYGDRIELQTPVTGIEQLHDPEKNNPRETYRVETPSGEREFDAVVVTTPAGASAELLEGVVPDAAKLRELRYNPLALVYLDASPIREGFGYQVGYGETLHTLGVSWNASMFDRDGVHTVFLGGMHEPDLVSAPDERLGAIARREFENVMGTAASVIDVARPDPGFPAWDQSWWALDGLDTPPGLELATNYTARMGVPSRVREARQLAQQFAERASKEESSHERAGDD